MIFEVFKKELEKVPRKAGQMEIRDLERRRSIASALALISFLSIWLPFFYPLIIESESLALIIGCLQTIPSSLLLLFFSIRKLNLDSKIERRRLK